MATCNFDGAGPAGTSSKWRDDYNRCLKSRDVFILPDNDAPGLAHATAVANSLVHVASAVRVVELPGLGPDQDVSDWLDIGHTQEELQKIALDAPHWESDEESPVNQLISGPILFKDLLSMEFRPLQFLVEGLIAKGHFAILGGRPKSGKSWFGLQLARAIDEGTEFLGRKARNGRVLYVALEDGQPRVYQRCQILGWKPNKASALFDIGAFDGRDSYGPGIEQIFMLTQHYDLIIVDTLIAALSGRVDENSNTEMGAIVNALRHIAHENDTAILLVHHTGKGANEDPFANLRGASALRGSYDLGLILERKVDEREALLHIESRDFDGSSLTIVNTEFIWALTHFSC